MTGTGCISAQVVSSRDTKEVSASLPYQAYIIGPDGHVANRVDLNCKDETEAIRLAKQLVDGHDVELWQLDRKIQTFRHTAAPDSIH